MYIQFPFSDTIPSIHMSPSTISLISSLTMHQKAELPNNIYTIECEYTYTMYLHFANRLHNVDNRALYTITKQKKTYVYVLVAQSVSDTAHTIIFVEVVFICGVSV